MSRGATVWLTGLSGAGKTTIAVAVAKRLRAAGREVEVLDGDELRRGLSAGLGFSRDDRDTHVRRVGFVAELLARHGVVALGSGHRPVRQHPRRGTRPPRRARHWLSGSARGHPAGRMRPPRRQRSLRPGTAGELTEMTGVDDPYEEPDKPDLRLTPPASASPPPHST